MKVFDSKVQETKYKVLREVAYHAWQGQHAFSEFNEIASEVIPKNEPPQTCCIYKDRAVVAERIRLALGGSKKHNGVVQVIDIACDECPEAGHVVTDLCRGCLAHSCLQACPKGAIVIDEHQHAHIDKSKCIECGLCAKACKYGAIHNFQRPCERACKVDAISMAPDGEACIDYDKCISCGSCVYQCPFGAPVDVSSIVDVVDEIRNEKKNVIAIVAPSIAAQFQHADLGQIITGIRLLGFSEVLEVATGAEITAYKETMEFKEKGFLTTSCCPSFVKYVETKHPKMVEHISHNLSPMAELGKLIKEDDPDAVVVFIGPCIGKKAEVRREEVSEYVDYALTFEELMALYDSKDITLKDLEITDWDQASYYGRGFARSGGVSEAIKEMIGELGLTDEVEFNPAVCEGIDSCRIALLRASKGVLPNNFIEGMACVGGCIGGSGNLIRYEDTPKKMELRMEDTHHEEMLPNVRKHHKDL